MRRAGKRPLRQRPSLWWGLFGGVMVVAAGAAVLVMAFATPEGLMARFAAPSAAAPSASTAPFTAPPARTQAPFDPTALSIDDPTSYWVVVDKVRPLQPESYVPKDLVTVATANLGGQQMRQVPALMLKEMFDAYHAETGRSMKAVSGYRSYATQKSIFHGDVNLTAKPGYSEHQSGLAMDIGATTNKCTGYECFADEPEGKWLAANAYKWGFILRYPKGMTNITGYQFEPWHYRYVGPPLAYRMHDAGVQTLEQMFNLPAAPAYVSAVATPKVTSAPVSTPSTSTSTPTPTPSQ